MSKNDSRDIFSLLSKRAPQDLDFFKDYLKNNRVVLYMIAKKLAGKGTYSGFLSQISDDSFVHISIGDIVRETRDILLTPNGKEEIVKKLENKEIKSLQFDDIVDLIVDHSNKQLLPTELIFALLEAKIEEAGDKSIIIDGFPRTIEQLDNAKQLADKFAKQNIKTLYLLIDCPEEVLKMRMQGRRVCPNCSNSRNIDLLLTDNIGYDPESTEFYLVCDNPDCNEVRMIDKKGDEEGYESILERNNLTVELMNVIRKKYPEMTITVSNAVEVNEAKSHDQGDFTEKAFLTWDPKGKKVIKNFGSLVVTDDDGKTKVLSRYAEPVVVDIVKEFVKWIKNQGKV